MVTSLTILICHDEWDNGFLNWAAKFLTAHQEIFLNLLSVVAHAFNASTWGAEACRSVSSRPAWSRKRVQHNEGYTEKPCVRNCKGREVGG